ncbi:prolipoprotein diacylglyceryl transferase [Clostridium paridis]|uniref:Phosphatidylglycerol--prolipoprotein diacylglyceryl transferase n=1 Tax=Clostridium paridis TaxID=2803863 RepID=A0A937FJT8_9CLOT|nr:prolipoprotein diacylglyceryl transferase [Clostridium paridis]MBL4933693.1 prolipoprotein diacylglyceryl transferase [Clostridium paridis]
MNPIAFELFGIEFRWYGIFISLGIIAAFILAYYNAPKRKVDFEKLIDIFIVAFPLAIIGARGYYVLFEWNYYSQHTNEIINIRQGGLAIHGGILGAMLGAFIYTRWKKIRMMEYADLVAPSIILAQGFGRWGNFFNGEAHGDIVSKEFISKFPAFIQKGMFIDGSYYQPTFLYESIWNILVCIILVWIYRNYNRDLKGRLFFAYVILYSIGRFFIEGMRTDSLYFMGLRIAQVVSLIGIIGGIIYIAIVTYRDKKNAF